MRPEFIANENLEENMKKVVDSLSNQSGMKVQGFYGVAICNHKSGKAGTIVFSCFPAKEWITPYTIFVGVNELAKFGLENIIKKELENNGE